MLQNLYVKCSPLLVGPSLFYIKQPRVQLPCEVATLTWRKYRSEGEGELL